MVDGYYNIQIGNTHTILALWALSSAMVKYSAYHDYINYKPSDLT